MKTETLFLEIDYLGRMALKDCKGFVLSRPTEETDAVRFCQECGYRLQVRQDGKGIRWAA